jgi:hypothetical protein
MLASTTACRHLTVDTIWFLSNSSWADGSDALETMDPTADRVFRLITSDVAIDSLLDLNRDVLATDLLGVRGEQPTFSLAMEFLFAARMLLDSRAHVGNVVYTVTHPVLFLVRHSLELYLKALLDPAPSTHDLEVLLSAVNAEIEQRFGQSLDGSWFQAWVREFRHCDPTSMQFRYVADPRGTEFFPAEHEVNFEVLRKHLDLAAIVFYPFYEALRGDQSRSARPGAGT